MIASVATPEIWKKKEKEKTTWYSRVGSIVLNTYMYM
jgi:hypothetical protein